jgi:short-subunit dehydrogenase
MKRILVLGGYSGIAQKVEEKWARQGASLYLVGRSQAKLEVVRNHLLVLGAKEVYIESADLNNLNAHKSILQRAVASLNGLDLLFVCYGILPDQKMLEEEPEKIVENYNTNAISVIHFVTTSVNYFESRNAGTIAVVTSVAGERGRKSNYFYGSAKACVDIYLEGLRHRLFHSGVKVITIKPGVVDTPMTKELGKKILIASPERVAEDIIRGIENGKHIIYTPWYWKYILGVIKLLPERIFSKLEI